MSERVSEIKRKTRYPASVSIWQYRYLVKRDGDTCQKCGISSLEKNLEIDRIDGDPGDNDPSNLRLLCHSCNVSEWHKRKFGVERVSVCVRDKSVGAGVERQMNVEREPPEMRVARTKEPLYTAWILENINRSGGLTMYDAIYEGAECMDISPITARRWLMKKLTKAGMFRLGDGARGHQRILLREGAL